MFRLSSYRQSLFTKLTLGLTLVPIVVFSVIMLWSGLRTQNTLRQELVHQINDEMAALAEIYVGAGADAVAAGIDQRLTLTPLSRAGAHYSFIARGGETLAGDLAPLSDGASDITKTVTLTDDRFGHLLMRSTIFRGGEVLNVARETDAQRRALSGSLRDYFIGVAAILALSLLLIVITVRRLRKRLSTMNSIFARVGDGDIDARLSTLGHADELSVLAKHINAMIARTGRLLTLRKRVTDQVAHEMRSPLTRLDASLFRIENNVGPNEAIDQARDELKHCINLLDGLLDISSLDAQQGDKRGFETIDFSQLVEAIADLFDPVAEDENKPLQLSIDRDVHVFGSSSQLGRLVSNLFDNALKYAFDETAISVSLKREGEFAVLRVSNRGAPISAETARDIFTPFFRNPEMSAKKGYGLGLALSRSIANRHDGFLELEPTPTQILFKLTLPIL
jgi:signal transduction histidine kinase